MNEQKHVYGTPCKGSLGPEFIYPFIVLFFATILRKIMRYFPFFFFLK